MPGGETLPSLGTNHDQIRLHFPRHCQDLFHGIAKPYSEFWFAP
jgi:hypothetical protein